MRKLLRTGLRKFATSESKSQIQRGRLPSQTAGSSQSRQAAAHWPANNRRNPRRAPLANPAVQAVAQRIHGTGWSDLRVVEASGVPASAALAFMSLVGLGGRVLDLHIHGYPNNACSARRPEVDHASCWFFSQESQQPCENEASSLATPIQPGLPSEFHMYLIPIEWRLLYIQGYMQTRNKERLAWCEGGYGVRMGPPQAQTWIQSAPVTCTARPYQRMQRHSASSSYGCCCRRWRRCCCRRRCRRR